MAGSPCTASPAAAVRLEELPGEGSNPSFLAILCRGVCHPSPLVSTSRVRDRVGSNEDFPVCSLGPV